MRLLGATEAESGSGMEGLSSGAWSCPKTIFPVSWHTGQVTHTPTVGGLAETTLAGGYEHRHTTPPRPDPAPGETVGAAEVTGSC